MVSTTANHGNSTVKTDQCQVVQSSQLNQFQIHPKEGSLSQGETGYISYLIYKKYSSTLIFFPDK